MAKMDPKKKRTIAAGIAASSILGTAAAINQSSRAPTAPEGDEQAASPAQSKTSEMKYGAVVGSDWDMHVTRNERVDFFIEFLSGKKHDDMREWLERLGRYAPMIQAELRERGMPEDLVFLAMMESGLDPNAYSKAHAAGMWQFIAETGQRYGLDQTSDLDERRDPVKATGAALDYLQVLHKRFGSWYLAAAAYNTGENRIERILRERAGGQKGDEDLYWQISPHIPRETRDYVPLMLAAGHIAKNPEKYGFRNLQYQQPLEYDEVEVPAGVALKTVAQAVDSDLAALKDLNPHLIKDKVPSRSAYNVRIPAGTRNLFAANFEAALTGGPRVATSTPAASTAADDEARLTD